MLGSICGDIIGSRFEFNNTVDPNFELFHPSCTFTDDTILTVATAEVLRSKVGYHNTWQTTKGDYANIYQTYFDMYPGRGWGGHFAYMCLNHKLVPYNSYGNGSAMRVGPIGLWFETVEETLLEARKSAEASHNHPEGVKGAQAVALATFLARTRKSKKDIENAIISLGMYDLDLHYSEFPKVFDETCQGTVPLALSIFLDTLSFEEAMRASITNGGDVDTIACIVGGIAEAFYGELPKEMVSKIYSYLPEHLRNQISLFYGAGFVEPDVPLPTLEVKEDPYLNRDPLNDPFFEQEEA